MPDEGIVFYTECHFFLKTIPIQQILFANIVSQVDINLCSGDLGVLACICKVLGTFRISLRPQIYVDSLIYDPGFSKKITTHQACLWPLFSHAEF